MGKKKRRYCRKGKKPEKEPRGGWLARRRVALEAEDEVAEAMALIGVLFRVVIVQHGRCVFPHWIFEWYGWHVDYWPTEGKWRSSRGGKGTAKDPHEVADRVWNWVMKSGQ